MLLGQDRESRRIILLRVEHAAAAVTDIAVAKYRSWSNAVAASSVSIAGGNWSVSRRTVLLMKPQRRTTASDTASKREANWAF